ncbi:MAG: DoxX family protein [Saprospiraceae bacterium]
MNWTKVIYWISTIVMCLVFTFSVGMYITNYDGMMEYFPKLGFPAWLVLPLIVLKTLGIVAVLSKKSKMLKEWAYAGFFFDAVMAFSAHYFAADGGGTISIIAIISIIVSRLFDWLLYK